MGQTDKLDKPDKIYDLKFTSKAKSLQDLYLGTGSRGGARVMRREERGGGGKRGWRGVRWERAKEEEPLRSSPRRREEPWRGDVARHRSPITHFTHHDIHQLKEFLKI